MCGIAGILNFNTEQRGIDAAWLIAMSSAVAHRGPDGEGYSFVSRNLNTSLEFSGPDSPRLIRTALPDISGAILSPDYDLALAHRRFSIVDLSSAGHQPFFDSQHQVCVILNGEIYNYIEVRQELIKAGHQFETATDTEVLVRGYLEWGKSCFEHLNGMWALALYDFRKRRLILSRDRLGKRPLYYFLGDGWLVFASEIKALLHFDFIRDRVAVNEAAIRPYILFGWRDLDNETFFSHIQSLPAASYMSIDLQQQEPVIASFWSIPRRNHSLHTRQVPRDTADELRVLLSDSVRIRMRADVPLAFELSGGMDSSSLVGLAASQRSKPLSAYTVGFDLAEWDETSYAVQVAARYNIDHRIIRPNVANFWEDVDEFVYLEEEPFHAPNLHTNYHLRRLIAADGFKVVMTGSAGDEVFAGYPDYFYTYLSDLRRAGHIIQYLRNVLGRSELRSVSKIGHLVSHPSQALHRLTADAQWFKWLQQQSLKVEAALVNVPRQTAIDLPTTTQDLLYENMMHFKLPYWLRSSDKTNMAIPLEPRSPFLDYRVVEFAFRLPIDFLIRNGWSKWILRVAMHDVLPPTVTWRKVKMGFPFPMHDWLAQSRDKIRAIFASMDNPFIDRRVIMDSLEKIEISSPYALWRLLSFELWHRRFMRQEEVRVVPGTHSLR